MQPTPRKYAESVRAAVTASGHSVKEVADVIGVSESTARRRLNGELQFTVGEIQLLSQYLDVPVASLLGVKA
jgi:transcriptional regulator with XRE-family HTH domain